MLQVGDFRLQMINDSIIKVDPGGAFGLVRTSCPPPPGLSVPVAVPDATAYWVSVSVSDSLAEDTSVCGLYVTCTETGVTQISAAVAPRFYATSTSTLNFSTPEGGSGFECSLLTPHTYAAASGSATPSTSPGTPGTIFVTHLT